MGVSYKGFLIGAVFAWAGIIAKGQDYDSLRLAQLPVLSLPAGLKSSGLPYKVDNSRTKYFPAIFTQYGYSCNQAASISVGFTYELNALRNLDAIYEENRLPTFFTWNMMNSGNTNTGVSYFESWDMVHAIGCPNWSDFGNFSINETKWMSGYYRYYRGMQNRVEEVYSIDVSTEQGLLTLKHWLYDHLGEYQPGGVANFQLATLDLKFWPLPEGTEDAGKILIPNFGPAVGHAMTFVGYNDSVRYDFNNDGKYTNNLDTNGDGKVTMADWEIGALICVNTYGTEWGSEGRAYVPYRILPLHQDQGGIWMKSVMVARPHKSYKPQLTLRTRLRYPDRSKIWITAGVSQDLDAKEPQYILDQPVFHYQGGSFPMQGRVPDDPDLIEIGIDATPLLNHVESGKPAAFFLVVCEQDPASASDGIIEYFSINEYVNGEQEHPGNQQNVPIEKTYMALPVVVTPSFNGPVISTTQLPGATAGQDYQVKLGAEGGTAPYKWLPMGNTYSEIKFNAQFPTTFQNKILPDGANVDKKTVNLPFDFPYKGKTYRQLTLTGKGGILLVQNDLFIPYGFELRELLGLNTAIYPFYSTEFQYPDYLDGVYYEAHPSSATVYWNASMTSNGQISDVNFSVRLYPSGVIEFYYGNFINTISTPWLIGLTGGSKALSYYPNVNATGISAGLNIRFQPPVFPEDLQLTPDGFLSCKPLEPGKTWIIPVGLEDYQGLRAYRELSLSTAPLDTNGTDLTNPKILVYPNPVTDRAYVQIESIRSGNMDLMIFDLTGKVLLTKSFAIKAGRSVFPLDLSSDIAPGIYIIQVTGITTFRSKIYFSIPAG
ncbi:MAG: T9SS C-terminal target domain-containing protein [Porphyromonadaceae bacterium]|nr:MAG: T9SS C-terminal target domain-containing protein [Porphyromonadaceae bacterium]